MSYIIIPPLGPTIISAGLGTGHAGGGTPEYRSILLFPSTSAVRIILRKQGKMIDIIPVNNAVDIAIFGLKSSVDGSVLTGTTDLTCTVYQSDGTTEAFAPFLLTEQDDGDYAGTFNSGGLTPGQRYKVVVSSDDLNVEWVRWYRVAERSFQAN